MTSDPSHAGPVRAADNHTDAAPSIKTGFRTVGYRKWPLQDAFHSIAEIGFDGVEICLEHPECRPEALDADRARTIAAMVADAGLAVASVSYHGDGEPPEARAQNQRRAVELAPRLGAQVLILNAWATQPGREEEQWAQLDRDLRKLLPLAESEGVFIALEPEPGHFLSSSADMKRLLDEIGHPRLRINLDVGHAFLTDPDVIDSIHALGEAIVHTHIEGMPAGRHEHLVPGEGDMDLRAVIDALAATGYSGYHTVDLFDIADDPEGYAHRSMTGLRKLLGG